MFYTQFKMPIPEGKIKFEPVVVEQVELEAAEPEKRPTSLVWELGGMRPGPASLATKEVIQLRLDEEIPDLPPAA